MQVFDCVLISARRPDSRVSFLRAQVAESALSDLLDAFIMLDGAEMYAGGSEYLLVVARGDIVDARRRQLDDGARHGWWRYRIGTLCVYELE